MTIEIRYDIFLSHNRQSKPWVRAFYNFLTKQGCKVFFDEESIKPGEPIIEAIEKGIETSKHIVLILTPESIKSKWVALETSLAITSDPDASQNVLIPVLLEKCDISKIRLSVKYLRIINLTDENTREKELNFLLKHLGINVIDKSSVLSNTKLYDLARNVTELKRYIIHELPPAPRFKGRKHEYEVLSDFMGIKKGVLSLIGIGGCGKTALISEIIRDDNCLCKNDFLFVWSFYENDDSM